MQRRTWLKTGLAGTAVLLVAGGSLATWRPGVRDGRFTVAGREVFAAVACAVLPDDLRAENTAAVNAHLDRLEATLAGFPPALHAEISQLTALLASAPGRLLLAGLAVPWPEAGVKRTQTMLQGLRVSNVALRQQTYHALRDLTNAAFYADPAHWQLLGYPGPRPVGLAAP